MRADRCDFRRCACGGTSGMHWVLFVEASGLDSAANRGIPIDSRDEDIWRVMND